MDHGRSLKRQLRQADRRRVLKAFALVTPLLAFLLVTFLLPIGGMLVRSVADAELAQVWPRTAAAVKAWDGRDLPEEGVFRALAFDLRESRAAGTVATAARRLNYDISGLRTLVMSTARRPPEMAEGVSARDAFITLDPRWGERATWAAIRRASGPVTGFYLLTALDLERDADGHLIARPPDQAIYRAILLRTFGVALGVTALCLLMGYPVAYLLATRPARIANLLMILVLLPFWTSLLVRTGAWVVLLQNEGLVNKALLALGILDQPVRLIYNRAGVVIAMTHVLLPFMILPLYSVMRTIPPIYRRAAATLGATPAQAFRRVYFPLSLPGVAAGSLLVFIIALGYYITPALVGGAADQMIAYFVAFYTTDTVNWGMASALGGVLLAATLILYGVFTRLVGAERLGGP